MLIAGPPRLSHVRWRLAPRCGLVQPVRARSAALVALGAWLASRGALAAFGRVATGGAGLAAAIAGFLMTPTRAAMLPGFASEVIAWAGGMTLAFGAALRA